MTAGRYGSCVAETAYRQAALPPVQCASANDGAPRTRPAWALNRSLRWVQSEFSRLKTWLLAADQGCEGPPRRISLALQPLESRVMLSTWPANPEGWIEFDTWHQRSPYNQFVPLDSVTGDRSVVGCVATAVAQVMQYWDYPGRIRFTDTPSEDSYEFRGVNVDNDAATYDFPDFGTLNAELDTIDFDDSNAENAYLSFAAGIKVEMNYSSTGSGAWFSDHTFEKLGFGSADYSRSWDAATKASVIDNLKSGAPVVVAVYGNRATTGRRVGHAVVLEGYRDDNGNEFLVNLGWGGADQWITLPSFTTGSIQWDTVGRVVYNITPTQGWGQEFGDAQNTSFSPYAVPREAKEKWHQATDTEHSFSGMIAGTGGNVYVVSSARNAGGTNSLWVINSTGTRIAEIDLPSSLGGAVEYPAQSQESGKVFIPAGDGKIYSVDVLSGSVTEFWAEPFGKEFKNIKIGESGHLYGATLLGTNGSRVYSIAPNGSQEWDYSVQTEKGGDIVRGVVAVDDVRDRVYVPYFNSSSKTSHLLVLDRTNGSEICDRNLGTVSIAGYSAGIPSIGPDGTVFVGSFTSVYALNPDVTLSERWRYDESAFSLMREPPTVGRDGTVYLSYKDASEDYLLAAIDPDDGTRRAFVNLNLGADDDVGVMNAGANDMVVFTVNHSNVPNPDTWTVYAYEDRGGNLQEVWRKEYGTSAGEIALGPGNTMYVLPASDYGHRLTALASGQVGDPRGAGKGYENNNPPARASDPGVPSGTEVEGTTVSLSWADSDPDGHSLQYTLLLGRMDGDTSLMLPQADQISDTSYTVNGLDPGETYQWMVVANDGQAETEGPTWVFSTQTSTGEIHGRKWDDLDGNRSRDIGEPGLAGWTIYLDGDQDGQLNAGEAFVTTDANGDYSFAGLVAGTYTVAEVLQDGWIQTYPTPIPPGAHSVAVNAGQVVEDIDFGNRQLRSAQPDVPDLVAASDTGMSDNDDVTSRDNSAPAKGLSFSVGGTVPGATVTIYATGVAIGTAVAEGTSTIIGTAGTHELPDGVHSMVARQTEPGKLESDASVALSLSIDTVAPLVSANALLANDTRPGLAGTVSDASATIQVRIAGSTYAATNNSDGTWTLADNAIAAGLTAGQYDVAAQATDPAGNVGTDSATDELGVGRLTYIDGDGDRVRMVFGGPQGGYATLTRATGDWGDSGDLGSIVLAGAGLQTTIAILVEEVGTDLGDGTTIQSITGTGIGSLYMPDVDLVGNTIELTGPLGSLTVRDIADGSDITLGGNDKDELTLVARNVGDVDLTFEGGLDATVSNWAAGTIDVNYIDQLSQTDEAGEFAANLDIQGADAAGWSLRRADIAGDVTGGTWKLPGALGRRYKRRGRWRTEGLYCAGDFGAALTVEGKAYIIDIDGQLQGAVDIGVNFADTATDSDLYAFAADAGSTAAATLTVHGNAGTVQFGDTIALTGPANGAVKIEGNVNRIDLYGGTGATGTIDVDGKLGQQYNRRRRGRRRWYTEGLYSGGDLGAALTVDGQAWLIDIGGQLQAPLTVGGAAERVVLDRGASATGDVTIGLGLTYFETGGDTFAGDLKAGSIGEAYISSTNGLEGTIAATKQVDVNTDGDTNDAVDTAGNAGSITNLSIQNGTAGGSSITVEGDLGGSISYRRRGRRRWRTVGFWSGGDVGGTIVVGGTAYLIEVDGQLQAAVAIALSANTVAFDGGATATGDVTVGRDLGSFTAGGTTFAGDLEAGSITEALINSTNGLQGKIEVRKDVDGDGTSDTTGSVTKLHVQNGTAAGATITVEGDLGGTETYRRRGRRRTRTVGFWSGGDVLGTIAVAGHLHLFEVIAADSTGNANVVGGTVQAGSMTDVRLLGGMTQTGKIETLRADDGAGNLTTTGDVAALTLGGTVEGDVGIGGHLGTLEAGYRTGRRGRYLNDASFTGTLEAGSMGNAYWYASNGIEGEVNVVKTDVDNDGDTDDAVDTTGNVDGLYVYTGQIQKAVHIEGDAKSINAYGGASADGDITVNGVLGEMQTYRRRGRRRTRPVGFWSGGNVLGDVTVTDEAYLIDIDGNLVDANIVFEPVDVTGVTSTVDIAGSYEWDDTATAVGPEIRGTSGTMSYLLTIAGGCRHNGEQVLAPVFSHLMTTGANTHLYWDQPKNTVLAQCL